MNTANGEGIEFHKATVDYNEYWIEIFLEILYIVVLTTCGLPRRTREMTSLKFANTMNGDRNIYLEDDQSMLVMLYLNEGYSYSVKHTSHDDQHTDQDDSHGSIAISFSRKIQPPPGVFRKYFILISFKHDRTAVR